MKIRGAEPGFRTRRIRMKTMIEQGKSKATPSGTDMLGVSRILRRRKANRGGSFISGSRW